MEKLYGCGLYIRHSFLLHKECLKSDLCTYSSDFLFVDYVGLSVKYHAVLRCGTVATCLLGLWVWILWGMWFSLVSVVCCQAEVSALGWSLIWRSRTEYSGSSTCPRVRSKCCRKKSVKYITFNFCCFFLMFLVHLMLNNMVFISQTHLYLGVFDW